MYGLTLRPHSTAFLASSPAGRRCTFTSSTSFSLRPDVCWRPTCPQHDGGVAGVGAAGDCRDDHRAVVQCVFSGVVLEGDAGGAAVWSDLETLEALLRKGNNNETIKSTASAGSGAPVSPSSEGHICDSTLHSEGSLFLVRSSDY